MEAKEFLKEKGIAQKFNNPNSGFYNIAPKVIYDLLEEYANTKAIKGMPNEIKKTLGYAGIKSVVICEDYFNELKANQLKWIPIDKENLPKEIVLARCEIGDTKRGKLEVNSIGEITCIDYITNDLISCTHYIDINKIQL